MQTPPTQELRRSVRIKIGDGILRLHHPVMPALSCTLLDLSEGGLRCRMNTSALDPFASTVWRKLLSSGKLISVEVLAPGLQQRSIIHGDVRHIRLSDDNALEFGLKFHKPDAMQLDCIERAIRAYSRQRERHPFQPQQKVEAPAETPDSSTVMLKRGESTRRIDAPVVVPKAKPKTLADAARSIWKGLVGRQQKTVNYRGMKIGEILMRMGKITPKQAVDAYEKARSAKVKFGRYLVRQRLITPTELSRALSLQTGLPIVDLATVTLPETVKDIFPLEILKDFSFVPFNQFGSELYIAVALPLSREAIKELEDQTGLRMKVFLAHDEVIEVLLSSAFFTPPEPIG